MNDSIINGLFTLIGVCVGSFSSLFIAWYQIRITRLNKGRIKDGIALCNEAEAFRKLEEMYIAEVSKLREKTGDGSNKGNAIKVEFRQKLKGGDEEIRFRPSDIKEMKTKFESFN